jgi:hypothetical protein
MFTNPITDGTNCSPFESEVIVEKAKEVFAIGDHAEGNILQPGQMIWTALDMNEPPGKPLKACKLRRIILTHIKSEEDAEVRRLYSQSAKRQQQINRMALKPRNNRLFSLRRTWLRSWTPTSGPSAVTFRICADKAFQFPHKGSRKTSVPV